MLARPSWIIEGVYYGWVARTFEDADKIIVLTPSVWTRDRRIVSRFLKRRAGLIPSKKETLQDLRRLIAWNHRYDSDHLAEARAAIAHLRDKVAECRSVDEVFRALETP